jgi:CheY-like chemotaxis protein
MPYTLLLADDSVTIQRVIELTFADEDVRVIAVGDGQQAIERIEAERPDIVLADVGMPERDGYEVAAFVKGTAHLSHIPVLLLTGAFEPVDERRASAAGCDGVLAKPFEPHMVITRVKELLAGAPAAMPPLEAPRLWHDEGRVQPEEAPRLPANQAESSPAAPGPPAEISSPLADSMPDGAVRISRRMPIAVPGFGSPTPHPAAGSLAALDEYFERLDAAFASLQRAPALPAPPFDEPDAAMPQGVDQPALSIEPGSGTLPAGEASPGADTVVPDRLFDDAAPAPSQYDDGSAQVPAIAQAFSALFAAERGEAAAGPMPVFFGAPALSEASLDDLVERVTQQVLERMSDRVVRDTVTEIVSRVSERLVRDEIDRVKATLK